MRQANGEHGAPYSGSGGLSPQQSWLLRTGAARLTRISLQLCVYLQGRQERTALLPKQSLLTSASEFKTVTPLTKARK